MCGDDEAAKILAEEVHRVIDFDNNEMNIPDINEEIDMKNLSIVVDPIDATQEYIQGGNKESQFQDIPASGLKCVTVLIGVYDVITGVPLMGVINQPFHMRVGET